MTESMTNPASQPEEVLPASPQKNKWKKLRRFGVGVVLAVLLCGIFMLVTNGIYLWEIRADQKTIAEARTLLENGLPDTAMSETERLAFYEACAKSLEDLPVRINSLNNQVWAFAVLIKDNTSAGELQAMLQKISRGQTAIRAYSKEITEIKAQAADFLSAADPLKTDADTLAEKLKAYEARVAGADFLETRYTNLSSIPDLDLAGRQYSRQDLSLDKVLAAVDPFRQPVLDLVSLIASSTELEKKVDELYAQTPQTAGQAEFEAGCAALLADQQLLISKAITLAAKLPEPLQDKFTKWQEAQNIRANFISGLRNWWQYSLQFEQSRQSAITDRKTAYRYIADSLKEENVETAYLWTKTAQEYRSSMNTAIDFANIYIGRVNKQIEQLTSDRQMYRQGLGLPVALRQLAKLENINAAAFWLQG